MSSVYGRNSLSWKDNKLLFQNRSTGYAVKPHKIHEKMFWIVNPDESLSEDFYNLTRAKDSAIHLFLWNKNNNPRSIDLNT